MKNVSNIKAAEQTRRAAPKKFITASSSHSLYHTKNSSSLSLSLQDKNVHDEAHKLMKKFSSPKNNTKAMIS